MSKKLSIDAMERIDEMVERVARKAGFTGKGDMTYQELLHQKFEQQYGNMLRVKDFTEEIKTYLKDGLQELMEDGYSEEEAIQITLEKIDEAELKDTFAEFAKAFEGLDEQDTKKRAKRNEDVVGLLYGFFVMMGLGSGTLVGYIFGRSWLSTITGLFVGVFFGVALAMLAHIIFSLKRD